MRIQDTFTIGFAARAICSLSLVGAVACKEQTRSSNAEDDEGDSSSSTTGSMDGNASTTLRLDVGAGDDGNGLGCAGDASCDLIDLLFVIDNSGTMGEEQRNLASNLPLLIEQLTSLTDSNGTAVNPSVNIMVTTTDFGHPLCTPFQRPGYEPRRGAPVYEGCNTRIDDFTGIGEDAPSFNEACTDHCPSDIAPGAPYIHFDSQSTNVPQDDVAAALSCIGPQGINGCGYEAPLETMLQAINPAACWNDPESEACKGDLEFGGLKRGFLRPEAVLAVAIITDELDCSVATPDGYNFFTGDDSHWNDDPKLEMPRASSAICWNAGVSCDDTNDDGTYESCSSENSAVLHPVDRYTTYLKFLREDLKKDVIMLGVLGVPPVTERNPNPPYNPTKGGVFDLVYRDWTEADLTQAEIDAGVTTADKRFDFGAVAPGCVGTDEEGNYTGHAIPPVRVKEVCESLNFVDENGNEQIRCCIESICDTDFSPAIRCLTGIIEDVLISG